MFYSYALWAGAKPNACAPAPMLWAQELVMQQCDEQRQLRALFKRHTATPSSTASTLQLRLLYFISPNPWFCLFVPTKIQALDQTLSLQKGPEALTFYLLSFSFNPCSSCTLWYSYITHDRLSRPALNLDSRLKVEEPVREQPASSNCWNILQGKEFISICCWRASFYVISSQSLFALSIYH